jgi:transposase
MEVAFLLPYRIRIRNKAEFALPLYYLPPYSPELNRIEILWKQAKYYWRRFCSLKGEELLNEVNSIFNAFGTNFTINLA